MILTWILTEILTWILNGMICDSSHFVGRIGCGFEHFDLIGYFYLIAYFDLIFDFLRQKSGPHHHPYPPTSVILSQERMVSCLTFLTVIYSIENFSGLQNLLRICFCVSCSLLIPVRPRSDRPPHFPPTSALLREERMVFWNSVLTNRICLIGSINLCAFQSLLPHDPFLFRCR